MILIDQPRLSIVQPRRHITIEPSLTPFPMHNPLASQPSQLSTRIHSALSPRERARRALRAATTSSAGCPPSQVSPALATAYDASDATAPANRRKNRYGDVLPYNRSRVHCSKLEGEDDYINGNWIEEVDGGRKWIACQAPLPTTISTFYSLLIPAIGCSPVSTPNLIVQLTSLVERGVLKADPYLPTRSRPLRSLPHGLTVRYLGESNYTNEGCLITDLELSWDGGRQSKRIRHLFFSTWPDKGVPSGEDATGRLVRFIKLVDAQNISFSPNPISSSLPPTPGSHCSAMDFPASLGPPIIVHCSAGVGRTGSFIAISSLLRLLPMYPSPSVPIVDSSLPPPGSFLSSLKTPSSSIRSSMAPSTSFPRPPLSPLGPLDSEIEDDPVAIVIDWCREQRCMMVETWEQVDLVTRVAMGNWK